jgi:hypothetical protein
MEPIVLWEYLLKISPIVALMGVVIFVLYRDSRESTLYIRQNDAATLITLKELTSILQGMVSKTDTQHNAVLAAVRAEAQTVKEHIDGRIAVLEARSVSAKGTHSA